MSDHRKEARKKLIAFTPVHDLTRKTLLGYVGDLTLQGLMVIGEKSVEINQNFTLGIQFPESLPDTPAMRIVISARAAWCRQTDGPQFNIGFEFINVSPEDASTIESVIKRYQFRYVANDLEDLGW